MKINLVRQPGDVFEIQLPEGDTLATGGKEIAGLFRPFEIIDIDGDPNTGWAVAQYDIDPDRASGVLGTVLRRERDGR